MAQGRPYPGRRFAARDNFYACGGFDVCDWGICEACLHRTGDGPEKPAGGARFPS